MITNPLVLLLAVTVVVGALITLGLARRGSSHRPEARETSVAARPGARAVAPGGAPSPARPESGWDLLDAPRTTVADSPPSPASPGAPVTAAEAAEAGARADDDLTRPLDLSAADAPTGSAQPSYADVALDLVQQGRDDQAVLARWAADLETLTRNGAPAGEIAGAVASLAPAGRAAPRAVLEAARQAVGRVVGEVSGPPSFAPSPLGAADRPAPPSEPVAHEEPTVLRRTAREAGRQALLLADSDAPAARAGAWKADLAAFDAVLVDAARRGGDTRLASVRLRRQLAMARLKSGVSEDVASTTTETLPREVHRVRATLRSVLQPHERDALAESLAPWPAA